MGSLRDFLIDVGRNAYGLGENVASLGSAAIAEPVAGYAAMFDPVNGAQAIREGMTYQPRTEAGRMYQQGAARTLGAIAQPAMPIVDTWQRGVDIAGGYSPMAGAMLRTVPTALGVALGAKPALEQGRQLSNSLGAMQARMVANANAPKTLNTGFMGQRGSVGTQRPLTEFEQAHLIAQKNAALPVSQGGLGLAPDNTAMDRAKALGYTTKLYRGTPFPVDDKLHMSRNHGEFGIFASTSPHVASTYALATGRHNVRYSKLFSPKVIPILAKIDNSVEHDYAGKQKDGNEISNLLRHVDYDDIDNTYSHDAVIAKNLIDSPNGDKYGEPSDVYALLNHKKIRSIHAAFDPFNRDSANLLAQYGAIAPAATLGALMANEKRKDKRN